MFQYITETTEVHRYCYRDEEYCYLQMTSTELKQLLVRFCKIAELDRTKRTATVSNISKLFSEKPTKFFESGPSVSTGHKLNSLLLYVQVQMKIESDGLFGKMQTVSEIFCCKDKDISQNFIIVSSFHIYLRIN